jgi:hypothetical protein
VTAFRNPAARDAAWGRYYARRGARVSKTTHAPSVGERLSAWASMFYRLPLALRLRGVE